jgi:hypothetical protein
MDPEIAFIIPLKAREQSKDWDAACALLDRTLISIDGQTCRCFVIVLVCNDVPDLSRQFENLTILTTDIRIEGGYSTPKGRLDKQRKVLFGLLHARKLQAKSAMTIDADDVIHKDLVEFVAKDLQYDAFLMNKGYTYHIGNKILRKIKNFHYLSGSTIVYPLRDKDFENVNSYLDVDKYYMTRQAHPKPAELLFEQQDVPFRYIPFFAGIYVRGHEDSIRDAQAKEHNKIGLDHYGRSFGFKRVRYFARRLFNLIQTRFVTRRIDAAVSEDFRGFSVIEK